MLWAQVTISNKGIIFLCGLFFFIEYISWRILTTKYMFDVANMLRKINCQKCSNKLLWASKHTGLIIYCYVVELTWGCTQSLVVICKFPWYPLEFQVRSSCCKNIQWTPNWTKMIEEAVHDWYIDRLFYLWDNKISCGKVDYVWVFVLRDPQFPLAVHFVICIFFSKTTSLCDCDSLWIMSLLI